MNQVLGQYIFLQAMDFLSTLAFVRRGVVEANPLVRLSMETTASSLWGVLAIKLLAASLGVLAWRLGKRRVLILANVFFACVVAWNLVALILRAV